MLNAVVFANAAMTLVLCSMHSVMVNLLPSRIVPAGRRSPRACGAGPRAARSGLAALAMCAGCSTTALACREGACGRTAIVAWASPIGARQAEGKASRGAGGRLRNAGQRAGAVHAALAG